MKRVLSICIIFGLCIGLSGCEKNAENDKKAESSTSDPNFISKSVGEETILSNDDGKDFLIFTINSATVPKDVNFADEKGVEEEVIINYTYENIGTDTINFNEISLVMIDIDNNVCSTYPDGGIIYPHNAPAGTKVTAEEAFGAIKSGGTVKIRFSFGGDKDYGTEYTVPLTRE